MTFQIRRHQRKFVIRFQSREYNANQLTVSMEAMESHKTISELIAEQDVGSLANVVELLGESKRLSDKVSDIYELLLSLVCHSPDIGVAFDVNQTTATVHCLQALKYNMIMGVTSIFRGHVTDSTNFSRKSIEIAAFLLEICSDVESAKRWIEMGRSGKSTQKYKSRFPAYQLVAKYRIELSSDVIQLYDTFCLFVHPSYGSMHNQITVTTEREHRFLYFEHETESQKASLLIQYFNLLNTHVLLVRALSLFFDKANIGFDGKRWQKAILSCAADIDGDKSRWLEFIKSSIDS